MVKEEEEEYKEEEGEEEEQKEEGEEEKGREVRNDKPVSEFTQIRCKENIMRQTADSVR